jgi:hypothetical protein
MTEWEVWVRGEKEPLVVNANKAKLDFGNVPNTTSSGSIRGSRGPPVPLLVFEGPGGATDFFRLEQLVVHLSRGERQWAGDNRAVDGYER